MSRTTLVMATLLVASLVPMRIEAQMCPPEPPDFRPHVAVYTTDTLLTRPVLVFGVLRRSVHCSYGAEPPVRRRDLRVEIVEGPSAGSTLRWTHATHDRIRVRFQEPGDYTLRVSSPTAPELEPATIRVRVIDRAHLLAVVLRVDRPSRAGPRMPLRLTVDGFQLLVRVRGDVARVRLPAGSYATTIGAPSSPAAAVLSIDRAGEYHVVSVDPVAPEESSEAEAPVASEERADADAPSVAGESRRSVTARRRRRRSATEPWTAPNVEGRGAFLIFPESPTQVYEEADSGRRALPSMPYPAAPLGFRHSDDASRALLTEPECIAEVRAIASDGPRLAVLVLAPRLGDGWRHYGLRVLLWDGERWVDLGRSTHEDNGDFIVRREATWLEFRDHSLWTDDAGVPTLVWSPTGGADPLPHASP